MLPNVSEKHDRWRFNKKGVAIGQRKGTWLKGSKLTCDTIIFFTYIMKCDLGQKNIPQLNFVLRTV